jgi:hypothetical protein
MNYLVTYRQVKNKKSCPEATFVNSIRYPVFCIQSDRLPNTDYRLLLNSLPVLPGRVPMVNLVVFQLFKSN